MVSASPPAISIFHIVKRLLAVRNLRCLVKQVLYVYNRTHRARIVPAVLSVFVWLLDDVRSQVGRSFVHLETGYEMWDIRSTIWDVMPSLSFEFFTRSL